MLIVSHRSGWMVAGLIVGAVARLLARVRLALGL